MQTNNLTNKQKAQREELIIQIFNYTEHLSTHEILNIISYRYNFYNDLNNYIKKNIKDYTKKFKKYKKIIFVCRETDIEMTFDDILNYDFNISFEQVLKQIKNKNIDLADKIFMKCEDFNIKF
jgi:hypothetical protein